MNRQRQRQTDRQTCSHEIAHTACVSLHISSIPKTFNRSKGSRGKGRGGKVRGKRKWRGEGERGEEREIQVVDGNNGKGIVMENASEKLSVAVNPQGFSSNPQQVVRLHLFVWQACNVAWNENSCFV